MLTYNSLENMNDRKTISILEKLFHNSTRDNHAGLVYIYIYIQKEELVSQILTFSETISLFSLTDSYIQLKIFNKNLNFEGDTTIIRQILVSLVTIN